MSFSYGFFANWATFRLIEINFTTALDFGCGKESIDLIDFFRYSFEGGGTKLYVSNYLDKNLQIRIQKKEKSGYILYTDSNSV